MSRHTGKDFFDGIRQVDVFSAGEKVKLPIFYRDARAHLAIFPASIFALKKILPDPRFVPAQILPGIGGVALASLEYHDTDIGPYNEFSFSVMLNNPHILPLPGYNMLRQLLQFNFYTFIRHLPVTTEAALRWGIDFSGFPKFLASIDFEDTPEWMTCVLKEKDDLICRVSGRKISTPMSRVIKMLIRLYQNQQPQTTEFKTNARSFGISLNPGDVELELGTSHPMAVELDRTLLMRRSLMYFYMPSLQFVLYGPENMSLPLIDFLIQKGMRIPLDSLKDTSSAKGKKA